MIESNGLPFISLFALFMGVTACGGPSPEARVSEPSAANPPSIVSASANPRADLVQAMRASLAAKSYRVRRSTMSSNGRNRSMSADVVMPDRMHISTEMESPGRGTVKQETIYVGETSYARVGTSPWQKDPMGMGNVMAQMSDPKLADEVARNAEVKYLGKDSLDGAPMLVYEYTIKNLLGPGKDGVSKIWVGASDHLQHQVESESDIDPLNTGKPIHSRSTTKFYDYNAAIKIEAPL